MSEVHWAVSVSVGGELILTIETNSLCGRELSDADKEVIRTAAQHLLAFVGSESNSETKPNAQVAS